MKKITQNIKAIILGLILTLGMGYAVAQTFTGPTCSPTADPGCNTPAPINVGGNDVGVTPYSQLKTGLLTLMSVITPDLTVRNTDSSPVTPGQILTAVNEDGKVGWSSVASIASDMVSYKTPGTQSGLSIPAGAKFAKITVIAGGGKHSYGVGAWGYSYGGVAQSIVSLSGATTYTVVVGGPPVVTARPGSDAHYTGGSSSVTLSNGTSVSATGGSAQTNGTGTGDFTFVGPYLTYGNPLDTANLNDSGAVLVEFY